MAGNFNYPQVNYDYNGLLALGKGLSNYATGLADQRALSDFNGDWKSAAERLMRMGRIDDAVKLYTAGALADYRGTMASVAESKPVMSPEDRLVNAWITNNGLGGGPSYLSPPDSNHSDIDAGVAAADAEAAGTAPPASGVPGITLDQKLKNAPKAVQDKLMSIYGQKREEALGTTAGQREGSRQGMVEAAPQVQGVLNEFAKITNASDPDTFENALGPLQGVPTPDTWQGALSQAGAQTAGSVANYFDQGMKNGFVDWNTGNIKTPEEVGGGFTSTLRDTIQSTQATLINILQRTQRVVGIGSQSDKELQQIVDQVGKLGSSRTKKDFYDRLGVVVDNLRSAGIPVEMPKIGNPTKPSDRYSNPSGNDVAPRSVPTFNIDPNTGTATPTVASATPSLDVPPVEGAINGPVRQGPGAAPPKPPTRALNALKAYRNNPQARAAFDEIYGPGAADFYLQRSR